MYLSFSIAMSKPKKIFSNDERQTIIDSFENNNTPDDIARVIGVSKRSVQTTIRRFQKNGQIISGNSNNSRLKLLNQVEEERIIVCIDEHPELTLRELKNKIIFDKDVYVDNRQNN